MKPKPQHQPQQAATVVVEMTPELLDELATVRDPDQLREAVRRQALAAANSPRERRRRRAMSKYHKTHRRELARFAAVLEFAERIPCKRSSAARPLPRTRSTRQHRRTQHRGESDGEPSSEGDTSPTPPHPRISPDFSPRRYAAHPALAFPFLALPPAPPQKRRAAPTLPGASRSPSKQLNAPRR